MYLFKLLISASLKNGISMSYVGRIENKSGLQVLPVAGFVFILVLMFALQYLIKLGNEWDWHTSRHRYILPKQFLGKMRRLIVTARRTRLFHGNVYCFWGSI
jgi:hypothetical protein